MCAADQGCEYQISPLLRVQYAQFSIENNRQFIAPKVSKKPESRYRLTSASRCSKSSNSDPPI
jgi:hypothetical protein